jgi:hypothetical protein
MVYTKNFTTFGYSWRELRRFENFVFPIHLTEICAAVIIGARRFQFWGPFLANMKVKNLHIYMKIMRGN